MKYFIALMLLSCAGAAEAEDKSKARLALEAAGYTEIRDESSSIVGCSKEDSILVSRKFTARSPGGQVGSVRVCCGLVFRGCVVRW